MEKKNHNFLYLRGDHHWTDESFRDMVFEEEGVWIPDEDLHTPKINQVYIDKNPEKNAPYIAKKLAEHGLLQEES